MFRPIFSHQQLFSIFLLFYRCFPNNHHPLNRQEAQVLKALVLGEEERGQSQYQVMCFVTKFQKGDFISSDAMAKLRQVRKVHICFVLSLPQSTGFWSFSILKRNFCSKSSANLIQSKTLIRRTLLLCVLTVKQFHMDQTWTKKSKPKIPETRKSCLFLLFLILLLRFNKLP